MTEHPWVDPTIAASYAYRKRAAELAAEAKRCAEGGYHYWYVEYTALADIAERAAIAEEVNRPPEGTDG